jgi:hypothetical protein
MDEATFPEGFVDLTRFVGWAFATETARSQRRRDSTFDEIQSFYDAILPRLIGILEHLNQFPLDQMPEPERMLLNLSLAFAEIAPFAEQYRRTILPENFDERRFVPMHDLAVTRNA